MRFIQIIFFIILLSCSNSNSGDAVSKDHGENTSGSFVGIDGVDKPLLGKGTARIVLNAANVPDGDSYLISSVAGGNFRIDSSTIQNGKLVFESKETYPQGLYYASLSNQKYVQFFLAEDQKFELSFDGNEPIRSMNVKGSKENEVFYRNLKYEDDFNPKYQSILKRLSAIGDKTSSEYTLLEEEKLKMEQERKEHLEKLFNDNEDLLFVAFKKAGQNPKLRESGTDEEKVYFYRKEFWDNVDFSDRRLIRTPVIKNKLERYIKTLTPQNADSLVKYTNLLVDKTLDYPEYFKYISNWIAIEYEAGKTTLMDPEKLFVNIVQRYFTREHAFWADSMEVYALQQRAGEMAQSLVGLKGPDVVSTDQYGKTKSIYEKDADYIVVYLYNPTCEHCMKETPLLVEWYNKNKNKGMDVFAIAIDTDEQEWKGYIEKNKMDFTNVFDPTNESIYARYYVNVTPEVYLLNKERVIIGKNLKVFQIDEVIAMDKRKQ